MKEQDKPKKTLPPLKYRPAPEPAQTPPVPDGVYTLHTLSKQLKKTQLEAAELLIWTLLQSPAVVNKLSLEELVEKFKNKKT